MFLFASRVTIVEAVLEEDTHVHVAKPFITGVDITGAVIVCTPVNVFAASVRAIVADVEGKVIVVPSVPARVRVLENVPTFPEAALTA